MSYIKKQGYQEWTCQTGFEKKKKSLFHSLANFIYAITHIQTIPPTDPSSFLSCVGLASQ